MTENNNSSTGKNDKKKNKVQLRELMTGSVLKPFEISTAIMFFQQFTGIINAIVYKTVTIFQAAGSTIDSRYCTIIVGAVQLVFQHRFANEKPKKNKK
jgi:uncharacterized membrane protein YvlD (DUF360 family)